MKTLHILCCSSGLVKIVPKIEKRAVCLFSFDADKLQEFQTKLSLLLDGSMASFNAWEPFESDGFYDMHTNEQIEYFNVVREHLACTLHQQLCSNCGTGYHVLLDNNNHALENYCWHRCGR